MKTKNKKHSCNGREPSFWCVKCHKGVKSRLKNLRRKIELCKNIQKRESIVNLINLLEQVENYPPYKGEIWRVKYTDFHRKYHRKNKFTKNLQI